MQNSMLFECMLWFYIFRVNWVYPNPNPKLRVAFFRGCYRVTISITRIYQNPNYPTQTNRVTRTPRLTSRSVSAITTSWPRSPCPGHARVLCFAQLIMKRRDWHTWWYVLRDDHVLAAISTSWPGEGYRGYAAVYGRLGGRLGLTRVD
jgi:hypothetical protein